MYIFAIQKALSGIQTNRSNSRRIPSFTAPWCEGNYTDCARFRRLWKRSSNERRVRFSAETSVSLRGFAAEEDVLKTRIRTSGVVQVTSDIQGPCSKLLIS